jgi:hypothetical protein
MPNATRTFPPDIPATITQANLFAGLRDALSGVFGTPPLKSFTSGTDQMAVWQIVNDATKTFGSAFYRLRVTTALAVSQLVGSGFTDATNTVGNPSADAHPVTYVGGIAIRMRGFSTPEYKFLSIIQGTSQQLLGGFRPPEAPAYEESGFPRFFIGQNADFTNIVGSTLTPYVSALTTSLGNTNMANADNYLQVRSLSQGFFIWGPNNSGIIASSSEDLSSGCCFGLSWDNTFNVPGTNPAETYFVHRGTAGALMFRLS